MIEYEFMETNLKLITSFHKKIQNIEEEYFVCKCLRNKAFIVARALG